MIRIERVTDGIDDEVDRLAKGLGIEEITKLESVLLGQFVETQAAVHRITGSLASSGQVSSDSSESKWEGTISYGGPSSGVHNPVKYAEYERERGDLHDFLEPAIRNEGLYVSVFNEFLGG